VLVRGSARRLPFGAMGDSAKVSLRRTLGVGVSAGSSRSRAAHGRQHPVSSRRPEPRASKRAASGPLPQSDNPTPTYTPVRRARWPGKPCHLGLTSVKLHDQQRIRYWAHPHARKPVSTLQRLGTRFFEPSHRHFIEDGLRYPAFGIQGRQKIQPIQQRQRYLWPGIDNGAIKHLAQTPRSILLHPCPQPPHLRVQPPAKTRLDPCRTVGQPCRSLSAQPQTALAPA